MTYSGGEMCSKREVGKLLFESQGASKIAESDVLDLKHAEVNDV